LLIPTLHWYQPKIHGSRQINRASHGRVAAKINIVSQTPYHPADIHKALSGSIFGVAFDLFNGKMNGFFKQARSMCLKCTTTDGSLAGKLGLNFGSEFKSDGHAEPPTQFYALLYPKLPPTSRFTMYRQRLRSAVSPAPDRYGKINFAAERNSYWRFRQKSQLSHADPAKDELHAKPAKPTSEIENGEERWQTIRVVEGVLIREGPTRKLPTVKMVAVNWF
jgi:hypothetical protein